MSDVKVEMNTDIVEMAIGNVVEQIRKSNFKPEGIVVITRGGLVAAGYFSQALNIKLIDTFCIESYDQDNEKGKIKVIKECDYDLFKDKEILVVDDLQDSGHSLAFVHSKLADAGIRFKTAILYHKKVVRNLADFCSEPSLNSQFWIVFPWEKEI